MYTLWFACVKFFIQLFTCPLFPFQIFKCLGNCSEPQHDVILTSLNSSWILNINLTPFFYWAYYSKPFLTCWFPITVSIEWPFLINYFPVFDRIRFLFFRISFLCTHYEPPFSNSLTSSETAIVSLIKGVKPFVVYVKLIVKMLSFWRFFVYELRLFHGLLKL